MGGLRELELEPVCQVAIGTTEKKQASEGVGGGAVGQGMACRRRQRGAGPYLGGVCARQRTQQIQKPRGDHILGTSERKPGN